MPSLDSLKEKIIRDMITDIDLDKMNADLLFLKDINGCGDMDIILDNPNKTIRHKTVYVQKIIDSLGNKRFKQYLQKILNVGELDEFKDAKMCPFVDNLQEQINSMVICKLKVALEFDEKDLRDMVDLLTQKMGTKVALAIEIDKNLLGGAIVQCGNYLIDHSLKSKFINLEDSWTQTVKEENAK